MASKNNKPSVPKGWVAVWDDTYNEWFYVNEATGKSQWEAPQGTQSSTTSNPDAPPPYSEIDSKSSQQQGSAAQPVSQQGASVLNYPSTSAAQTASIGTRPQQQGQYPQYSQYPQTQSPYGYQAQQQYGYPPQQPMYAQQYQRPSRFGGMGGMGMMGGVAAGALGGLLLGDMMTPDTVVYDNGGDFGGGDFGGGDFGGGDFGGF